jgi:hypothetical protein
MYLPCQEHGIRNLSKFFHDAAAAVRPAGSVVPSISNYTACSFRWFIVLKVLFAGLL